MGRPRHLSDGRVIMKKLYVVTISTEVIVAAESAEEAEEITIRR